MDVSKAKFLLENLLDRVETLDDGSKQLSGKITENEYKALEIALTMLDGNSVRDESHEPLDIPDNTASLEQIIAQPEQEPELKPSEILLETSVLELPLPSQNVRMCLDFGTAMSKATLVIDHDGDDYEEIEVLKLGIPADQEEVSEVMLISSVYIDEEGKLWFGKQAQEEAKLQPQGSARQQLSNIKRYLSEEGLNNRVSENFNPTGIEITYGELIVAYLTYFTWCINESMMLLDDSYPKNLKRRFAMPCLSDPLASEAEHRLRKYLGEAQVLADTFADGINTGIKLSEFLDALKQLRKKKFNYEFITDAITEPLGVAGSLLGPETVTDMLAMVIDVGAGTTDYSLYRIKVDPENDINTAFEVAGTSSCLTEAGNYLDKLLKAIIIREAEVPNDSGIRHIIDWEIETNIRDYKETLFNEGEVFVFIRELNKEVTIDLQTFLSLPQVITFADNLRTKMIEVMEKASRDFANWIVENPSRNLVVVLTGGGAELPMVQDLAKGTLDAHGLQIPLAPAKIFPTWLDEEHADLEEHYPRIAVALGGARRRIIARGGELTITGSSIPPKPFGVDFTTGR
ncbi:hypothetical protein [Methylophaga thiooxydans]|uniref:hypothetical protein n=1 Tax=Methylophaga thiooxydans TaxID=392484 RepID=UPI002357B96B|nr:hypothetical protein [Methylophaga thiooxydans]